MDLLGQERLLQHQQPWGRYSGRINVLIDKTCFLQGIFTEILTLETNRDRGFGRRIESFSLLTPVLTAFALSSDPSTRAMFWSWMQVMNVVLMSWEIKLALSLEVQPEAQILAAGLWSLMRLTAWQRWDNHVLVGLNNVCTAVLYAYICGYCQQYRQPYIEWHLWGWLLYQ